MAVRQARHSRYSLGVAATGTINTGLPFDGTGRFLNITILINLEKQALNIYEFHEAALAAQVLRWHYLAPREEVHEGAVGDEVHVGAGVGGASEAPRDSLLLLLNFGHPLQPVQLLKKHFDLQAVDRVADDPVELVVLAELVDWL